MPTSNYNSQVFINCPFDGQYIDMFRACVFTILDAGLIPRCSLEVDNATEFRLGAIVRLVQCCRYGVHDLSRVDLDTGSRLPRFNMPFELGVFYSARHFGGARQKQKQCIVLEKERYRYQKFISDISGIDVTAHHDSQRQIIKAVRGWLVTATRRTTIPPSEEIYSRFKVFQADIRQACRRRRINYDSMPYVELVHNMTDWLRTHQIAPEPLFPA